MRSLCPEWLSLVAVALVLPVLVSCSPSTAKVPESTAHIVEPSGQDPIAAKQDASPPSPPSIMMDVTDSVGIDFVHFNHITGEFMLPEITGSGAALFDYDNDGDLDLYLVQGTLLKPDEDARPTDWKGKWPPHDRLYRNDLVESGRLGFTDVTKESGIVADRYGMGATCADYDNDGWVDLYVTNVGSNHLFHNNGNGTFSDVTEKTGTDDPTWSTSSAFFDYDRDGYLDLFVANYVAFSVDLKRRCFSKSSARDWCGPDAYDAKVDRLLHNRGDGTFDDVTVDSRIKQEFGAGLGVVCADFNEDGWTDIYVANDGDPNQLWVNERGTGRFRDEALLAGSAVNSMGRPEAGMGVDVGDFDGDGDLDMFMTHIDPESNTLYVNVGDGMYEDRTIQFGLHLPSLAKTSFGTGFFDYDNDGWLDLLALNGAVYVLESLLRQKDPYPLHQHNQLYQNRGGTKFVEVTDKAGDAFRVSEVSRGAAFGDVDNDGDMDVAVLNNHGRARLLLNQVGNQHDWIGLRVLEDNGKRDALHARIEVTRSDGKVIWRRVRSDGGYCSSHDPRVLIGLGAYKGVVSVRVHWPNGNVQQWGNLGVGRYWVLQREQEAREVGTES